MINTTPANTARHRAASLVVLASALLAAPALLALHFQDGPPARVTGGFGEDSCLACHSGNALNDAGGRLSLSGFPERYTPGETYEFELALSRPSMAVAGFQLAVRHAGDRAQAGSIVVPAEDEASVGLLNERGVQFAHHLLADATRLEADTVHWKLSWTAPEAVGPVIVHAAAIAADGDKSQLGDYVYTLEAAAGPARAD